LSVGSGTCRVPVIRVAFSFFAPSEPSDVCQREGILKHSLCVACIAPQDFASCSIPSFIVHLWVPDFVIPRFGVKPYWVFDRVNRSVCAFRQSSSIPKPTRTLPGWPLGPLCGSTFPATPQRESVNPSGQEYQSLCAKLIGKVVGLVLAHTHDTYGPGGKVNPSKECCVSTDGMLVFLSRCICIFHRHTRILYVFHMFVGGSYDSFMSRFGGCWAGEPNQSQPWGRNSRQEPHRCLVSPASVIPSAKPSRSLPPWTPANPIAVYSHGSYDDDYRSEF